MEKTKLVATVCENKNERNQIEEFIKSGIDVIRLNMSYSSQDVCRRLINIINETNEKLGTNTAIMLDLEGPCIRTDTFIGGKAYLNTDDKIRIYMNEIKGNMTGFSVNYKNLVNDLKYHTKIKLSKGNVVLQVTEKGLDYVVCAVLKGGEVSDNSKIYVPEIRPSRKFLTKQDYQDILFAHEMGVDFIVVSGISSAEDVLEINDLLIELKNEHIGLIAKIENKRAVEDIDNIINIADGIILDRGDLGIEMPIEIVPNIQKKIIHKCYEQGCLIVITAEFNSFLTKKAVPNRAEVSDLSTLVSEAIDAIMLTSETTIGAHPIDTVRIVSKIIRESEDSIDYGYFFRRSLNEKQKSITSTVSSSVVLGANELDCKAILVATNFGRTARRISQLKPPCPIIAAASNTSVVKSLQLHFGVLPVNAKGDTLDELTENVKKELSTTFKLNPGDKIIITGGYPFKKVKYTNFMQIDEI
ncbi:pyruvate kinase [Firmicutes bacterium CAG:822]|nr:pyruvate kinase [Firmicutes bacterium CAG:822]